MIVAATALTISMLWLTYDARHARSMEIRLAMEHTAHRGDDYFSRLLSGFA